MGHLYKLTAPNGKGYIGITLKTLEEQWAKHVEHALGKRTAGALYHALRKYGPDNFTKEILSEESEWDTLCDMERKAIKEHGTLSPGGYNISEGGDGVPGRRDEETCRKIAVAQKKRFTNPDQLARLADYGARGRESLRRKLAAMPPKPKKSPMSKAECSRRIREAMARPEVREKVLACAKARAMNPEFRKKISASKLGKSLGPASESRKRKISEARKREWADPLIRERRLKALVLARAKQVKVKGTA